MSIQNFVANHLTDLERAVILEQELFSKCMYSNRLTSLVFLINCVCKKAKVSIKATMKVSCAQEFNANGINIFEDTILEVLEISRHQLSLSTAH